MREREREETSLFAHAVLFLCPVVVGEGQSGGCPRRQRVRARGPLSVIGNLYFCRPYQPSALTPCFRCTGSESQQWVIPIVSIGRHGETRGLSHAAGMLSICVSWLVRWLRLLAGIVIADDFNLTYNAVYQEFHQRIPSVSATADRATLSARNYATVRYTADGCSALSQTR